MLLGLTGLLVSHVVSETITQNRGGGAVGRNRTGDLLITNQLLYQLSYNSILKGEELYLRARQRGNVVAVGRLPDRLVPLRLCAGRIGLSA